MELSLADLTRAADEVHAVLSPTPQYVWPLLCERVGAEVRLTVGEDEIRAAVRHYFTDTHNVAEGAGAAPLAAALQERARLAGRRVGLVLSGGNVDLAAFREIAGGAERV
jgi:threonine dehydratase